MCTKAVDIKTAKKVEKRNGREENQPNNNLNVRMFAFNVRKDKVFSKKHWFKKTIVEFSQPEVLVALSLSTLHIQCNLFYLDVASKDKYWMGFLWP